MIPLITFACALVALIVIAMFTGCRFAPPPSQNPLNPPVAPVGSEKNKISLPLYTIEPPDVLEVDAIKIVPKSATHK